MYDLGLMMMAPFGLLCAGLGLVVVATLVTAVIVILYISRARNRRDPGSSAKRSEDEWVENSAGGWDQASAGGEKKPDPPA